MSNSQPRNVRPYDKKRGGYKRRGRGLRSIRMAPVSRREPWIEKARVIDPPIRITLARELRVIRFREIAVIVRELVLRSPGTVPHRFAI